MLDAASNGAMIAINLILGIIANLVAFVSFMAFLNGVVGWLGYLIGYDYLSFEWIFAKAFIPLAYIMGIPWDDCENVGKIIATKTMINEFVAYERLGKMKAEGLITVRKEYFKKTESVYRNSTFLFWLASKFSHCNICRLWFCKSKFVRCDDW